MHLIHLGTSLNSVAVETASSTLMKKVEITVREWQRMQDLAFYREGILSWCQDGTNASVCSGIMWKIMILQ